MRSKRFELEIEARLENLSAISNFIARAMKQAGADKADIFKVQMAVDEACTNIIRHAYSEQKGVIILICEFVNDSLIVIIKDKGKIFDASSVPSPDLEADLDKRKIGGLGIYLMRRLMNEVRYTFDAKMGNVLTMRKHLTHRNNNRSR